MHVICKNIKKDMQSKWFIIKFNVWNKFLFKSHFFRYVHKNMKLLSCLQFINQVLYLLTSLEQLKWEDGTMHFFQKTVYPIFTQSCEHTNLYLDTSVNNSGNQRINEVTRDTIV